ncbi:MAG: hypothetical protein KF862_24285 [Chitinophagaceae bacterium]|nr:hypothetical protein [Chitinophagaceae bacterium]
MKPFIATFIAGITAIAFACKTKPVIVQPSFYFWKSNNYGLSDAERKYLDTLNIQKLYVKFFEVAPDPVFGNAPIAKTSLHISKWDSINAEIIPVVFIKNEIFLHVSKAGLDSLADNLFFLVNKITEEKIVTTSNEIQLDCDWTATTKEQYFYLLKSLKRLSQKTISVTLRLYPYKYPEKMGVPPVDKATLMCYNLVNALQNEGINSILDLDELKRYMGQQKKYPVRLDIALPVYSWMLVYQNEQFMGPISQQDNSLLDMLTPLNKLWYEVSRDTVVDNYYLRSGDKIKFETITPDILQQAAIIVKQNTILSDSVTVSLFHLDEQKLSNYSYEILHNVFTAFSE